MPFCTPLPALQGRLHEAVDAAALFAMSSAAAIKLVGTCKAIADGWHAGYMQVGYGCLVAVWSAGSGVHSQSTL